MRRVWEDKGSRQGGPRVRVTGGSRSRELLPGAAAGSRRPGHKMAAASPALSVPDLGAGGRCCGPGQRQAAQGESAAGSAG